MSTLPTVQAAVTTPSLSATPPALTHPDAEESGSLRSIVQETVQNDISIEQAAQRAPVPMPKVQPPLRDAVKNANGDSAKMAQLVAAVMTGEPEEEAPALALATPTTSPEAKPEATVAASKMEEMGPAQRTVTVMGETVIKLYENFTALQVAHLPPGGRSSAEWEGLQQQVRGLLDGFPQTMDGLSQEEGADVLRVLLADTYEKLECYADSARTRESLLDSLHEGLLVLEGKSLEARLDYLNTEWAEVLDSLRPDVEASREMGKTLDSLALGQPLADNYVQALNTFREQGVFFEEDYHALKTDLDTYIGTALREKMNIEAQRDSILTDAGGAENVQSLYSLALDTGLNVEDVTRMMQVARSAMTAIMPEAAPKLFPAMLTVLLELAAEVKAEAADAAQKPADKAPDKFAEVLQHVDALFQPGYPESGGLALQLKQALVSLVFPDAPDSPDALAFQNGMNAAVEAQHNLTQSLRVLLDKAGEAHGAQGTAHGATLSRKGAVKDTLRQGVGTQAGMGQSLLLTPATVRALVGKAEGAGETASHTGGVNYHLAHLVLLQATAAEYGFINMHESAEKTDVPMSEEVAAQMPTDTKLTEANMVRNTPGTAIQQWCHTLGLNDATAAYAREVAQDLSDPERTDETLAWLQEASVRYTKGLSGSDDAQRAAESLRHVGGMNALPHSIRHEMSFYNTDPLVQQRRALDMYLMGFGGELDAKERLERTDGLTAKAGALETAIGTRLDAVFKEQEAKLQIIQGQLTTGEKQQMQNRHSPLLENVHHRRALMKHWKEMQGMADAGQELLLVRSEYAESKATLAEHKAERREMGIRWPHQHKERQKIRDRVLFVGHFMEGKDRAALTPEDQGLLDKKLEKLAGCDPFKLLRSHSKTPPLVTLDTVLDIMLPKAKALEFFADYGRAHTFGDRVTGRMRMGVGHLAELHQRRHARQALSHEGVRTLRAAVEAAAIMALQASGQPRGAFSMAYGENREAVMQQLAEWGLSSSRSTNTLTSIANVALRKATFKDGTLNLDKLAKHAESWARHRVFGDSKAPGQLHVYMKARKDVLLSAVDATRTEGLSSLLAGLDAPGSGFVYDKGRGVVLDSGARFTPLGEPITRRGTRCPLSLQIQAMRNRSVAVVRTPTGYQVLLKDKTFVAAALSGRLGLGHGVALSGSVGTSGDKMEGLALDFKDSATCQRFLRDFMDHDSPLHEKNTAGSSDVDAKRPTAPTGARASWLDADQIRFLDGRGGSVNASLGLNLTLFTRFLDEEKQHAFSGAASASASGKASFSTEVERSSQGETVTVSSSFLASAAVGLSGSLINAGVGDSSVGALTTGKHLNAAKVQTIDITEKLKVSTDGTGLSAKTCRDYEYGGLGLRHGAFLNNLPQELRERLEHDLPTMEKLKEAQARATPMTKMSVHWDITPEALGKARTLMMQARHSAPDQSEALLHEAHALLSARSSYTPTRITIQDTVRRQVGHNYSPGLGFIKLARTNHMLRLQSEVISLANLPPVPPAPPAPANPAVPVMNADKDAAPEGK